MTDRPWLCAYPQGVPADIDPDAFPTLLDMLEQAFATYADKPAYTLMGVSVTYRDLDRQSRAMAAYFQSLGLQKGDRVAVMMPNLIQYPVTVAAILRAGLVAVNVNPLYTVRELEYQLKDSGAVAIVIVENFAHTLQQCLPRTSVRHVVLCALGDSLGLLKGTLVNLAVRHVKKMVPAYQLPGAVRWRRALAQGGAATYRRPELAPQDLALLQYTGGTTGISKGAMLTHRNIVANTLQARAWFLPVFSSIQQQGEQLVNVCALPLYHIFAFTVNMMLFMHLGGRNILIPNPRDLQSLIKTLMGQRFHSFPAVNTLFNALARHPDIRLVDWSHLRVTIGGGASVQSAVAKLWQDATGAPIYEGYGLSEASPVVCCNPITLGEYTGTIGVPLSSTWVKLISESGDIITTPYEPGEIAIQGPQVMAGYWQRPQETAQSMTEDGYFLTGDIGIWDSRGFIKIVDRKKDVVLVSGFNVYPNEVEAVVAECPGVKECAVVGVPDERMGETVKLLVVRDDPTLTEQAIRDFCVDKLTNYKRPHIIEFREDLPKSPIGKILRRELRSNQPAASV